MATSSLESKTVRPGNLGSYSYYHSARRPDSQPGYIAASRTRLIPWRIAVAVALVAAVVALPTLRGSSAPKDRAASQSQSSKTPQTAPAAAVVVAPARSADKCAGDSSGRLVLVSISQRHMWACSSGKTAYDSPVITGMTAYASTMTPPGTYHIYSKKSHVTLKGSDVTGSWNDPVSYWMPFLSNQYGIYGFHDATWRPNTAFGKVSPDSSDASHGCVELPLATSAWLYKWAAVGTTVTIKE